MVFAFAVSSSVPSFASFVSFNPGKLQVPGSGVQVKEIITDLICQFLGRLSYLGRNSSLQKAHLPGKKKKGEHFIFWIGNCDFHNFDYLSFSHR